MADKPFNLHFALDSEILGNLNGFQAFRGLSKLEQEIIYWLNFIRANPHRFYTNYIIPFSSQFPEAKGRELSSLEKDMSSVKPMSPFEPIDLLNHTAAKHAGEIASGRIGFIHGAAGGRSFEERMKEAGINGCAGENLYEGKNDPLVAVILLLIDKDVPGSGHRKVILHPSLNTVGVSFIPGSKDNYILVQDFSCK